MRSGICLVLKLRGPNDIHKDVECDIPFMLGYSAGVRKEFKLMRVCKLL